MVIQVQAEPLDLVDEVDGVDGVDLVEPVPWFLGLSPEKGMELSLIFTSAGIMLVRNYA